MTRALALFSVFFAMFEVACADDKPAGTWQHLETRRFHAIEAHQGVAVDAEHFYAITNRSIGKYRRDTGVRVGGWKDAAGGRLKHLNAGVVFDGKLYCAHSNFPALPEQSSVEIWDTGTMQHLESRPFKKAPGSLTWIDKLDGKWFACFAHYRATGDPAKTRVMSFDGQWNPLEEWSFPATVIARFGDYSSSGGSFGPNGHLFVSGHNATELYLLDLPEGGGIMVPRGTVEISAAGQAFAWDRTDGSEGTLYSIQRKTKEVIVSTILRLPTTPLSPPMPIRRKLRPE